MQLQLVQQRVSRSYAQMPTLVGDDSLHWEEEKHNSHKKQEDSLEGGLDRVSFAVELEVLKILVPRLLQNSSNINTEFAENSKQLYSLCDQLV